MLLPQHFKIMSYPQSISTLSMKVGGFPLGEGSARVGGYNSLWAAVAKGKRATSITPEGVILHMQHNICHYHLLNKDHWRPMRSQCYSKELPADHHKGSGGDPFVLSSCEEFRR